jgi:dihydroorotase
MSMLLSDALLWENNKWQARDVTIDNTRISKISPRDADSHKPTHVDHVINCSGKCLIRGFADIHVHLREPGFSHKETIKTGTLAGARGGYTFLCAMPNLNPAPDTLEKLEIEKNLIDRDAVVKVYPYGCITQNQEGKALADLEAMAASAVAFSDDGHGVQSEKIMLEAMKKCAKLGKIIAAHLEVETLKGDGYINEGAYARTHNHKGVPAKSEWEQLERDLRLVEKTGCRYHVCHISTKQSIDLMREAKAKGLPVTCETAPHYLVLCDENLQENGNFKMNPPLRSKLDMEALQDALAEGTIDCIATDHAPHSKDEKSKGLAGSAFGIVGLETAFPVLYTELVLRGKISLEQLIYLMNDSPRRIFGLDDNEASANPNPLSRTAKGKGHFASSLKVGDTADLTLLDVDTTYKINPDDFLSKGRNTPFSCMEVQGKTVLTMVEGRVVWQENTRVN